VAPCLAFDVPNGAISDLLVGYAVKRNLDRKARGTVVAQEPNGAHCLATGPLAYRVQALRAKCRIHDVSALERNHRMLPNFRMNDIERGTVCAAVHAPVPGIGTGRFES
jgi:hypothetical protein